MRHSLGIIALATTFFPELAAAFLVPTTKTIRTSLRSAVVENPAQTSKEAVDAVRYRGDNCDDEYDAIIIGSGIGGLTTASLLAQSGERLKVLVLEQHTVAGGCCHTFKRGEYSFPTGIHYLGDLNEGDDFRSMVDALTPQDDPLKWDRIDPIADNFDTVVLGSGDDLRTYRIVGGGIDAQAQELKKQFPPDTHAAIDKYYSHIERAAAAFDRGSVLKTLPLPLTRILRFTRLDRLIARNFRKYASKTVAEVVNSLTDNDDLRAVMSYCWDDYGCEPSRAAFLLHAVVVKHYSSSAFFPRGGPGNIAKKIIPSITAAGGTALTGAPVKHIVLDEETGRAIGVEMMDGRVIHAKRAVISDAGLANTLQHLLPNQTKNREKQFKRYFGTGKKKRAAANSDRLHEGSSGLNLFVGLKGDYDSDFNLPLGQLWAFPNSSVEQHLSVLQSMSLDEAVKTLEPKDIGLVFIGSSSCKDSTWKDEHPGKTTLEIMASAPYKWFQKYAPVQKVGNGAGSDPGGRPGSHGKEYKKMKEELSQLIWTRAVEVLSSFGATNLPPTLDEADYHELGTPLTFAHYYWKEGGAFYGLDHDLNRFTSHNFYEILRPEIREIPGLYLTGQDVESCGFGGALIGGVLCAGKVLGVKNPFSLFDDIAEGRRVEK